MCCECDTGPAINISSLDNMLAAEQADPHGCNLITVLQKTQSLYGYIPRYAVERISRALRVKPAKILGVATFYSQFRMSPPGSYSIQICQGTACHVNGADAIGAAFTEILGVTDGESTRDGMFTLQNVACLGCCSLSPVITVNGTPYGRLTPDSAEDIILSYMPKTEYISSEFR